MAKRPVLPDNYNPIGDRLKKAIATPVAVSYTHLTLPTNREV